MRAPASPLLLPAASLAWRELLGFFRQPSRVASALASPFLLWAVVGSGFSRIVELRAAPHGKGYLEFFYPGTILMVILFTAVYSTISVIEDRREGFLQSVLVAPVSRASIVLGRVLGASGLAVIQSALFLLLAPWIGLRLSALEILAALAAMALLGFALASFGFLLAWRMASVQGFHAVMMLLLMPMWVLSGALFPPGSSQPWVERVTSANPLTYGLSLLRRSFYLTEPLDVSALPGVPLSLAVTALFGGLLFFFGVREVRRR